MNFRSSVLFFSFLSLLSADLLANEKIPAFPLGIVIRPSLVQRFFDKVNAEESGINFQMCSPEDWALGEHDFQGRVRVKLSNPRWEAQKEGVLFLSSQVERFDMEMSIFSGCDPRAENQIGKLRIYFDKPVPLGFRLNLWNIDSESKENPSVQWDEAKKQPLINAFEAKLSNSKNELGNLNEIINSSGLSSMIVESLLKELSSVFSQWLSQRMRGMAYVEYLANMFDRGETWQSNIEIKKGAISLTNPGERLRQSNLAFGFYPRRDYFVVLGNGSVQLYFNSVFMNRDEMELLLGRSVNDEKTRLGLARDYLLNSVELPDPNFSRPLVPSVEADVSLILPESLINGALQRLYQQDLKEFETNIAFGQQSKGLITDEAVDVALRVQLVSNKAPEIFFESNRLNLSVSNYFLSIGTFIEDRLIPSTQVQAEVDIAAGLDVSGETVNLSVKSDTFKLGLRKGNRFANRFNEQDLRFIESVSNDLWKTFFHKYPKLPLFYTLFKSQNTDSEIQIVDLDVQNDLVFLHFNFEDFEVKL